MQPEVGRGRQILLAAALVGALTLTLTPALFAQDTSTTGDTLAESAPKDAPGSADAPAKDPWQFNFFLLGWAPSISGDATVRGQQTDVDVSLDTLLKHLGGALELGFELRKEKFGFYAQPNWIYLKADANKGALSGDDKLTLWLVDAGGFYQLAKWGQEKPVTLNALAGVRYWHIKNDLSLHGPTGATVVNGSTTLDLIDPVVGLQAKMYLTRKLSLALHGDVGGFGISDSSSDLSWQAIGTLGYDFTQLFTFALGYRALSVDKHSGSGTSEKGANLLFHGPILEFMFHW
jgi:hypothetical protein